MDKPHIIVIYLGTCGDQKLVLGSLNNINFKNFSFMYRRHNNKQVSQIYLSPDIQPDTYNVFIDVLLQRNNER